MKNIEHLRSRPSQGGSSTAHHFNPLPSTVNHKRRVSTPNSGALEPTAPPPAARRTTGSADAFAQVNSGTTAPGSAGWSAGGGKWRRRWREGERLVEGAAAARGGSRAEIRNQTVTRVVRTINERDAYLLRTPYGWVWGRRRRGAGTQEREGPHVGTPSTGGADLETLGRVVGRVRSNIERVIEGKPDVVTSALVVLLAEGHLLIEDVPGVGKTMLSKALARSIDCSVRRIQFTPDLLPSDVTGVSVFNQNTREFEFRPGGVFANIVVGDEINRASPKTQSALLECMEERQVTVDNMTYQLDAPFMVIATQNPIEMEGTYALPEAQRDRFMARVSVGYPVAAAEIAMIDSHTGSNPLDDLEPVTDAGEVRKLTAIVGQVFVSEAVQRYAVAITTATRSSPELMLGASPRATLHLVRAATATAAMAGGATAFVCAMVLGHDELVRVGALLLLLPVATAFYLGRSRYRLGLVRSLSPGQVAAGQQARVQLDLTNDGRMP